MSGWLGPEYKNIDEMRAKRDAALWMWQLESGAYWLLEATNGLMFCEGWQ